MSKGWVLLLAVAAAGVGLVTGSRLEGQAPFTPNPVGSYLVELAGPGGGNGHLLATFTNSGQLLTSHSGDLGHNPFFCQGEPPGRTGVGHGAWRRKGMTIEFTVVANRFDDDGQPIGFQKAVGQAQPMRGGKPGGRARISYLTSLTGNATCATDLTFVATPLHPPARADEGDGKSG